MGGKRKKKKSEGMEENKETYPEAGCDRRVQSAA